MGKALSIVFILFLLSSCYYGQRKIGSCITDDISLPGKKMCIEVSRDGQAYCRGYP